MHLKYFALDIETTGLRPNKDQVLQVACIYDNGGPIEQLKSICFDVWHKTFRGQGFALAMNAAILKRIVERDRPYYYDDELQLDTTIIKHHQVVDFVNRFTALCSNTDRPVFAGKNVGSFDLQFLTGVRKHHRSIDVGSLYLRKQDTEIPSLDACLLRAGLKTQVQHDALSDCYDVIRCVREHFNA